jgi:hypothetical protein
MLCIRALRSPGFPVELGGHAVILSHCPSTVWLSRTLLSAALTKVRLLFYVWNAGGKLAYPFCGTRYDASPLLYPYFWGKLHQFFPAKLIQENAPSIDFDQSRYPCTLCNDYSVSARDARSVGEVC